MSVFPDRTQKSRSIRYGIWYRMAGALGFEPRLTVLETVALPLNYAPKKMERKTRFELATPSLARRCSTTELFPHVVPQNRIELLTQGFSVLCSTNWATEANWRPGRDSNPWPPPWQGGILTNWTTRPFAITRYIILNFVLFVNSILLKICYFLAAFLDGLKAALSQFCQILFQMLC